MGYSGDQSAQYKLAQYMIHTMYSINICFTLFSFPYISDAFNTKEEKTKPQHVYSEVLTPEKMIFKGNKILITQWCIKANHQFQFCDSMYTSLLSLFSDANAFQVQDAKIEKAWVEMAAGMVFPKWNLFLVSAIHQC